MDIPYLLKDENSSRVLPTSHTAFRTQEPGVAHLYSVEANKGTMIFLSYLEWESGNREVRVEEAESDLTIVHRLTHGLRLSIERVLFDGHYYDCIALRSARLNADDTWSNLYDLSLKQIDVAAGFDATAALREMGVRHFVNGRQLNRRSVNRQFALYPYRDRSIPLNAFLITRLMPLLNRMRRSDQIRLF
ncbi:MAG: hypothetical protein MUE88_00035 [Flavobacteriales bacterium]|jgi:hypothetical protein|nr:hypothetical protein [Flavobacteriales bacterium]